MFSPRQQLELNRCSEQQGVDSASDKIEKFRTPLLGSHILSHIHEKQENFISICPRVLIRYAKSEMFISGILQLKRYLLTTIKNTETSRGAVKIKS